MTTPRSSDRSHLYVEAAEWFTAMQGGNVSTSERARFSEWLAQSAAHVEEYLKIASVWRELGEIHVQTEEIEALLAAALKDADAGNVVQLHAYGQRRERTVTEAEASKPDCVERPPHAARSKPARYRSLRWTAAALASVGIICASWFAIDQHVNGIRYRTQVGQQLTFSLADGSVVLLNTQSEVRVRMNDSERSINLVSGEAMFEVAKDPRRPFRVQAGRSVVEAVGTVFNVYRQRNAATVTVLEGRVIVADSPASARRPNAAATQRSSESGTHSGSVGSDQHAGSAALPTDPNHPTLIARLGSNEQAQISSEGSLLTLRQVSAEKVTAWTDRRLIFDGATLADIISEFNRYNVTHLRVDDAQLAAVRISAMFSATDPDSLIEYLKKAEGVSVRRSDDGASVLYRERVN